jgi:hypothetical protein
MNSLRPLAFALLLTTASLPAAEAPSLDELLRFPGSYSQICDARQAPFPAPIPGFRTIMHGEAGFSDKKLALIKQHRATLIPAIAARLESIDLTRQPTAQPKDPSIPKDEIDVDPIGADPAVFSTLLVAMIEHLDAVEVFPQLMALEEKFHTILTAAEKDPKAALPQFDGTEGAGMGISNLLKDGEEYDTLTPERKAETERQTAIFQAQAMHRDILALFVRSMRKAGYGPMLASPLEKTYGSLLKKKWADHEDFSKYKSAADIPEDSRDSVKFDPIHKVAYLNWDPVEIPYSEETRKAILDLTTGFAASVKK